MNNNQDTKDTTPLALSVERGSEAGKRGCDIEYIDLKSCILAENEGDAQEVRDLLKEKKVFLWNIMSSPGSGKTTFITEVIKRLGVCRQDSSSPLGEVSRSDGDGQYRFGVIEADIESTVDAEKMQALGVPTVQLRTGGGCHLDAAMVMEALKKMPLDDLDVIIVENVGNLVCPAEFDVGATLATMLLSVPEGDDKCIKYPLMFTVTKAVFVTKIDVAPYFDFNLESLEHNTRRLNKDLRIFPISVKTGKGMDEAILWIRSKINGTL